MKKILTTVFVALALTSCGSQKIAADGYVYEKGEYEKEEFSLKIVEHDTIEDLRISGKVAGAILDTKEELMAYSILKDDGNFCEMHIVRPEVNYMPEYIGHELVHCMRGRWHD